jgi:hypothetical protein
MRYTRKSRHGQIMTNENKVTAAYQHVDKVARKLV